MVIVETANDGAVTSNLNETAIVDVMPTRDHQPHPSSLPTENVFASNEVLVSPLPLQIEGLESQLDANILEEESEHFLDEDPILATELLRVKEWRKWRLEEYQSHISKAGPEIEREEVFALAWLGTRDIATAIQMSTIEMVYSNKVQAKLARSKEKLPVMEDSFHALSAEDLEEIDQANLEEGLQRSLMDFHNFPGEASTFQHDENVITQGEGPSNKNERENPVLNEVPVQDTVEDQSEEPVTVPDKDQVTVTVEVPAEDPVEEPVKVPVTEEVTVEEITAEVEEQVTVPNVTNAENIQIKATEAVKVPDEVLVDTKLDENPTDMPIAAQSHEMDVTGNLPTTLGDTNEKLLENLVDAQVINEEHLKDFESDDDEVSLKIAKRRRIIMSEPSESSQDDDEDEEMIMPTAEEGMQLITIPIQHKERELTKQLMQMKQNSTKNVVEDDENLLSSLFLKVDECQEAISTKFARVIELKGDIDRDAHENIFKQLRSMNDHQKDITKLLQNSAEKNERIWDKNFSEMVQILKSNKQRADNQNKELLNVILQQQSQIVGIQSELSAMRKENATSSIKVDKIDAKIDRVDGNVAMLIDYAKKGEESSHLALSPLSHSFVPIGRGRGRGRSSGGSGFSQFAGTTGPKFGVIDYFKEEQPKYTLNDAPPVIKKQPKKDQVEWVANQNRRLEDELKKGPEVPRRKMFYLSDEVAMMQELRNYTGHEGKHLDGGRSFPECIKWFREGVLPGESIQEAYGYYITGQVNNKYKSAKYVEDFRKHREHINKMLEKKK